ncbi:MAG: RNase adaptor protein RapZ [Acidobacteria bacterium RIFCSPLOWO2_12_FULL_67_14]|nr:MAG: RNase adaptor protein RapZ [Acidobacteria bacterium RIFCSPLOWO2_02_FULL_67_21]OFW36678.1 MAG: RNase adaptor protein RapZ [Acidobacteria bacterium RIFCSPLOWO2_12_FULL_67_14]
MRTPPTRRPASRRPRAAPASGRAAGRARRGTRRFIILTGLSGSGKTQAIRALEDLGYFCVDNLPTQLIPTMAELTTREDAGLDKVAIVVDVREGGFLNQFPRVYRKLKAQAAVQPMLIFLEASDAALVRRFSETRRPHPLAVDRSASEGIAEERGKLRRIRGLADLILDTSNLTVHELRDHFMALSRDGRSRAEMVVSLVSFGYKKGVPVDVDLVFDVRCLPNPYFVDGLRNLTGRDHAVIRYMRRNPATQDFLERLTSFLRFALPQYVQEGKSYLTVGIGCTGGRHRSVMIAEALRTALADVTGVKVRVKHRDS